MATARTLTELLFGALDRFGSRPVAMRAKQGGGWIELSYRDLADRIQDLSLGLLEIGIRPGDRLAILSENRPEWAIADYACLAACCADVPIYPTLPARQIEQNLADSGAVAVLVWLTVGGLTSLWCVWAAITSVAIDLYLRDEGRRSTFAPADLMRT